MIIQNQKTIIIAEAGVNHNGDLSLALELVEAAADSGADYVKFQTFQANKVVTNIAVKAEYQKKVDTEKESQLQMLKKLELPLNYHLKIIEHCKLKKIRFLSTAFDAQSFSFLMKQDLDYIKIASGEITNLPFLRIVGSKNKHVILSTGMSNLGEVEFALNVLESSGTKKSNITVLHCNTEYPTLMSDVNLNAMTTIANSFGVSVGYSDHTLGIEIPIAAVALGASVIEKHLTLNKNMTGPDHKASIEPDEFTKMCIAIRNIEKAMGDGIKRPSLSEIKNLCIARRSIVASKKIKQGEYFSLNNITVKRPGKGLSPIFWDQVIGQKSDNDYEVDDLIFFKGI